MQISFHGADRDELLTWQRVTVRPEQTFLVHGDEEAMQAFAGQLRRTHVILPRLPEVIAEVRRLGALLGESSNTP